ncbi:MAG TPA: hypothetical protein VJU81_20695 [Methylomirabilota bacterium]|nr:hypothetical protein [Methylomirabilota bacterium]
MIDGLRVTRDERAVAGWASRPLRTRSSAARAIVNLRARQERRA